MGLLLLVGCSVSREPHLRVQYVEPIDPATAGVVINAVKRAPAFIMLKKKAKDPLILVEGQRADSVLVSLYGMEANLGHRWATLKITTATGKVFRESMDENGEDQWILEYQPPL